MYGKPPIKNKGYKFEREQRKIYDNEGRNVVIIL